MASKVQNSVTLFGSPPWGFRVSGGKEFEQPLVVSRVTPGSTASKGGMASGDVIIAVNGLSAAKMTQSECETKVKNTVGSLYLVLEKNAASVSVEPSGEVKVDGDCSVYNEETNLLELMARHNRSAKPFPGSVTSADPISVPSKTTGTNNSVKPPGFRSVTFRPKTERSAAGSEQAPPNGE